MPWIESHVDLYEHPKLYALSTCLNVRRPTALGLIHALWYFTMKFAWRDGDLGRYKPEIIARACDFEGDGDTFIRALQESGWLDNMVVHDWLDYAGRIVTERLYNEKRKRRKTSVNRPSNVRTPSVKRPLPYPTVPNQTKDKDSCSEPESPTPPAPAPSARELEVGGDPVFPNFPIVGRKNDPPTWPLDEGKIVEYEATFSGLNVRAELRKAWQWARDNPGRRKTARGMPKFLFGWLERAHNRGSPAVGMVPANGTMNRRAEARSGLEGI